MLRKLTLLLALVVLSLCVAQAALAGNAKSQYGNSSPNGNAWGQSALVDGR